MKTPARALAHASWLMAGMVAGLIAGWVDGAAAAEPGWAHIADDGQAFNVGESPKTVRFGAGTSWVQLTLTGSAICWSTVFGSDPAPKTRKTCEIKTAAAAAAPAPAPVASPAPASAAALKANGTATLSWLAPTQRADGKPLTVPRLAGYRVLYGPASGVYTQSVSVKETSVTIQNLAPGKYFFVVRAVDANGRESSVSAEVSKTIP